MEHKEDMYGLVIAGGNSTRMGTDKAMLPYHGMPQQYYLYNMLQQLCSKVFISCNATQAARIETGFNIIQDLPAYSNIGPMAALLSAFQHYPGKSFIVTGCDYPFLTKDDMEACIRSIEQPCRPATFFNAAENIYEPLLGYYPPQFLPYIQQAFAAGNYSLQQILKANNAATFVCANIAAIKSVDTMDACKAIINPVK